MELYPEVTERLARLNPDQRAAATAAPGPVLCIAPAGSGKTTTLVARIAWLVASGVGPGAITAVTFNRRAAEELRARLLDALGPLGLPGDAVRVRTFHALALEILRSSDRTPPSLARREQILAELEPGIGPARLAHLDTAISRLKIDLGVRAADVEADPSAGPLARTFVAYEHALRVAGRLDFDDLILTALEHLREDGALLGRWRERCWHLLVDEVQDVDRAQLELALTLAAPANRIFLVGDDDQSIYGWRLADVRRIFTLVERLPGLRRVDLLTNFRCPGPVTERSSRLVARNRERFSKAIHVAPDARGRLTLAPDADDDPERLGRVFDSWPADGSTRAVLARTNDELVPAAVLATVRSIPFRASQLSLPIEQPELDAVLAQAATLAASDRATSVQVLLATLHAGAADASTRAACRALLGWLPRFAGIDELARAVAAARATVAQLRREDAALVLSTVHGTKGLEFDHVVVIMDADRFPSRRALDDAPDPRRALEEERRLAYVAWTRARRSLSLLYDPAAPSRFLLETFTRSELGLTGRDHRG